MTTGLNPHEDDLMETSVFPLITWSHSNDGQSDCVVILSPFQKPFQHLLFFSFQFLPPPNLSIASSSSHSCPRLNSFHSTESTDLKYTLWEKAPPQESPCPSYYIYYQCYLDQIPFSFSRLIYPSVRKNTKLDFL